MKKIKRIGRSKVPYAHQLPIIAENLAKKFNGTVFVDFRNIFASMYDYQDKIQYRIAIVPGLNNSDCTTYDYYTWPELLDKYFSLMKESTNV